MTTTAPSPADRTLEAIQPLFSRIGGAMAPVQFTGATGAKYNMGAGQPDPATLPRQELADTVREVLLAEDGAQALMYGDAQGYLGLREAIADKLRRWEGLDVTPDEVLVVNGSNHGLAVVSMAFINPGDVAIVEAPTFMGGLRPLRQLKAQIEAVPLDGDGLDTDALEEKLRALQRAGTPAKLLYTIPNFHNPAGVDMTMARRRRVAELSEQYNFVILEDDAYGELRFSGEPLPALYKVAPKGRVLRSATLSKILAAGLRIGYVTAPKDVIAHLNSLKLDGGASPFTNRVATRWMQRSHDAHVQHLPGIYERKRDALIRGMERGFEGRDELRPEWTVPKGGFFLWLQLPPQVDGNKVAQAAAERGVGYVPGPAFFADGSGSQFIRLAWSMLSPEDLDTAGGLVAEAIIEAAR